MTENEIRLYSFIKTYINDYGYAPFTKEILSALDIKLGEYYKISNCLMSKGYIHVFKKKHRGIKILK